MALLRRGKNTPQHTAPVGLASLAGQEQTDRRARRQADLVIARWLNTKKSPTSVYQQKAGQGMKAGHHRTFLLIQPRGNNTGARCMPTKGDRKSGSMLR